jgi:hypothetical protein
MSRVPNLDSARLRLRQNAESHVHSDHFVEFYDRDEQILQTVGTFISTGLQGDDAAVVIATPDHLQALEADLERSINLAGARAAGRYASFEAEHVLDGFMQNGMPDPLEFDRIVSAALGRVSRDGRSLRVFGEMVGVLWQQGNITGALALEDLWNDLIARRRMRLFCAYPSTALAGTSSSDVTSICDRHTHVLIPTPDRRSS